MPVVPAGRTVSAGVRRCVRAALSAAHRTRRGPCADQATGARVRATTHRLPGAARDACFRSTRTTLPTTSPRRCATRSWAAATPRAAPSRDAEVMARLGVSRDARAGGAGAGWSARGCSSTRCTAGLEVVRISVDDVRDLFATRRTLELAGLEAMVRSRPADDVWLQAAVSEHDRGGQGGRRPRRRRRRRRVPPGDRRLHLLAPPAHRRRGGAARAADRPRGRRPRVVATSTTSPPTTRG